MQSPKLKDIFFYSDQLWVEDCFKSFFAAEMFCFEPINPMFRELQGGQTPDPQAAVGRSEKEEEFGLFPLISGSGFMQRARG